MPTPVAEVFVHWSETVRAGKEILARTLRVLYTGGDS